MIDSVLRGREVPLRALRDGVAAAANGHGRIIVLAGEAGIGKSALASALADEATGRGAQVTWGRAWEFADAPPYFPLLPCLRTLDIEAGETTDAFALWERVVSELAHGARERPVVWVLEDLHAADLGTLDLLTFLAQPIRAMRALVVITLRPQDPRLGDRQLQRLARIARDGIELRLETLGDDDVAAVTADTLGHPVSTEIVRRLVELTGGNPLFVVECARAVRAGGIERMISALPPTVRQIVLERVALLPEATRRVLDAGAILGRELSAATVARMLDSTPVRVIDELLPALRAGVVREVRSGAFVFSHVLVRDAIEDALGPEARAELHARADRALAALGDGAEVLLERARHALATRTGDPAHAVELVELATRLLEREGAFDRAFELHARANEVRAAGFLPPASAEQQLHVAKIAREAGRPDETRRLCEMVIAAARTRGDAELLARAALLHATDVRVGVIDAYQIAMLEEVLRMLPPGGATACRVMARLATALQPADDCTVPNRLARDALAGAHVLGDDATILDVLDLGGLGLWGSPHVERQAWARELYDRGMRAGDLPKVLRGLSQQAMWRIELGDFAGFDAARTEALTLSEGLHPRYRWDALMLASGRACAMGRFAESDRYNTEVAQIAAVVDDPALALVPAAHEFARARLRRRPDEIAAALPAFEAAALHFKRGPLLFAVSHASALARLGEVQKAREVLDKLGTQARQLEPEPEMMAWLGEAYASCGTDAERRWARDVLPACPYTELFGFGVSYSYEGSIERILGLLDASLGDLEAAEAKLSHALELERERQHAPWVAQLAGELAAVLARRGRAEDARRLREEADAIARAIGIGGATTERAREPRTLVLSRTGDVWTIGRGEATARVKDSRGVQLLARLAERPNEEIHVLTLASDEGTAAPQSSAGETLDATARKAYRARLAELDEALGAAEAAGNSAAAARLDREKSALVRELSRASGLGGRARQTGSATERARINVQRRLKEVISRVTEANPELGQFLEAAIRTGTFCCFRP